MKPRDLIPRADWSAVDWRTVIIGAVLLPLVVLPDPFWVVSVIGGMLIGWQMANAFKEWVRDG